MNEPEDKNDLPLHDPRRGKDQVVMGSGSIRWPKMGLPIPQPKPEPKPEPKE